MRALKSTTPGKFLKFFISATFILILASCIKENDDLVYVGKYQGYDMHEIFPYYMSVTSDGNRVYIDTIIRSKIGSLLYYIYHGTAIEVKNGSFRCTLPFDSISLTYAGDFKSVDSVVGFEYWNYSSSGIEDTIPFFMKRIKE